MDDLSLEVENMKILLQNVTDELSLLKQKSQSDQENLCSKQREIEHLNTEMKWYKTVENRDNSELESCKSEVKKQAAKLKKVQELFSDAEVALLEKVMLGSLVPPDLEFCCFPSSPSSLPSPLSILFISFASFLFLPMHHWLLEANV